MALFAGTFENRIDGKGRVSVPAPFRAELERASAVYLCPSFTGRTIKGYPVEWMEELKAGLRALPEFSPQRQALSTALFGRARLIQIDPDGRIVLPRDLADGAGIADKAAFVGQGDSFEIWEPAEAAKAQDEAVRQVLEQGLTIGAGRTGGGS